jgi:hypothetical protein
MQIIMVDRGNSQLYLWHGLCLCYCQWDFGYKEVTKIYGRKKIDAYFSHTNSSQVSGLGCQGSCAHKVIEGTGFFPSFWSAVVEDIVATGAAVG